MKKNLEILYIIFLASNLGMILLLGIVVASTIFNSEDVFQSILLTQYQEGVLMTQIFIKYAYVANALAIVVFLYESYQFKTFVRDKLCVASGFIVFCTSLLFTSYYMPFIIEAQEEGDAATKSEAFLKMHLGSEIDFKLLALALLILVFRRIQLRKAPRDKV